MEEKKYPKLIMTIGELTDPKNGLGFTRHELLAIAYRRNQKVAWKCGKGGRTSTWKFDTTELEKFRRANCTGV